MTDWLWWGLTAILIPWIGHAGLWTYCLNVLYGCKIPKPILKPWRIVTGLIIVFGFPALIANFDPVPVTALADTSTGTPGVVRVYFVLCSVIALIILPMMTAFRLVRRFTNTTQQTSTTIDFWKRVGPEVAGRGKWWWLARLPFTCAFKVEFTELTITRTDLPPEWDGLSILHLSDLHYHGTPSRRFFDAVIDELQQRWPVSDLVLLSGDYVDSDDHIDWIGPTLGRLTAGEAHLAILGNHDEHHQPERIRQELTAAGFEFVGGRWRERSVRGVPVQFVGHEGPWFDAPPECPGGSPIRICISHSPDRVYWANRNGCQLVVAGHVHGGQIRLPVFGPIFVPSIYSRRFDAGVYDVKGTTLVVNRGLSGKEPIRFRCYPQVLRIVIRCGNTNPPKPA